MVLVEQNIAFGLSLVDTAHLLQTGVVVHSSPVDELDDDTLATHLGIGKVLQAATGQALAARQTIPARRARAVPTVQRPDGAASPGAATATTAPRRPARHGGWPTRRRCGGACPGAVRAASAVLRLDNRGAGSPATSRRSVLVETMAADCLRCSTPQACSRRRSSASSWAAHRAGDRADRAAARDVAVPGGTHPGHRARGHQPGGAGSW
jgi:hypothetical protein